MEKRLDILGICVKKFGNFINFTVVPADEEDSLSLYASPATLNHPTGLIKQIYEFLDITSADQIEHQFYWKQGVFPA